MDKKKYENNTQEISLETKLLLQSLSQTWGLFLRSCSAFLSAQQIYSRVEMSQSFPKVVISLHVSLVRFLFVFFLTRQGECMFHKPLPQYAPAFLQH